MTYAMLFVSHRASTRILRAPVRVIFTCWRLLIHLCDSCSLQKGLSVSSLLLAAASSKFRTLWATRRSPDLRKPSSSSIPLRALPFKSHDNTHKSVAVAAAGHGKDRPVIAFGRGRTNSLGCCSGLTRTRLAAEILASKV